MIDPQTIKLLVIEDDEDDYFLLTVTLDEIPLKKEISWAPNFNKAKEFLNARDFDVCIVDYRLGAQTGIDVIKYIKTVNSYLPTILLTGLKENSIDEEALRSGAYDYLVKGQFTSDALGRSIRYSIERAKSIRSLKESEYKFRNLFENAIANTFIIRADGNIADVNRMARESLGIENSTELVQKHISEFIPLFAKINFTSSNLLEYLTSINYSEVDFLSAQGKKICSLYVSPVDSFRQLLQVSLIDITEQKAQKEKEKILEKQALTGKVAMIIAHEIKNPLTNINLSIS
jgi:PAS domain S-box-containing protein